MSNTRTIEDINRTYRRHRGHTDDTRETYKGDTLWTFNGHSMDRQRTDKDRTDNIQITQRG